ncbi:MAG: di-trans,poly-cis-decaprenylcistransferase [Clostridia bacterium]|nr:di-trans,poly-cis-decaprenylcistransferase [Clostridia bacterium]MDE6356602.1 di-trans,poly-cis-decaprenylcistransferase [Clostridia bacterium]MDE7214630.1 di-trans,poly-cis-decaprenylcistransferase [Clostridia bacterium]
MEKLPLHVGLIMDGNGRWAKKRLMPRSFGHNAGMNRVIALAEHAQKRGIKYLTVYALSSENLSRPKEELEGLYSLFRKYFSENVKKLYMQNAAVKIIGDMHGLPQDVAKLLKEGEENSPQNATFTMVFAINYGSRGEIARAARLAAESGGEITEKTLEKYLYTGGLPSPDLIIRTGGELRLSNFLLYQAAYAELYFTDVLFPDFTEKEFDKALNEFSHRERRFGKV